MRDIQGSRHRSPLLSFLAIILLAPSANAADPTLAAPPSLRAGVHLAAAARHTEAGRMLEAILRGSMMGAGDGWFGPSSSRFGYAWLLAIADANADGAIVPKELADLPDAFATLDRDGDGRLLPDDFDWSDASPFVQRQQRSQGIFRSLDADSNGKLDADEWAGFYERLGGMPDGLVPADLAAILEGRPRPRPTTPFGVKPEEPQKQPAAPPSSGMPSKMTLVRGLLAGEVGSFRTGPVVGQLAPDFTLTTQDEKRTITLGQFRGEHPVVLIFGSFT